MDFEPYFYGIEIREGLFEQVRKLDARYKKTDHDDEKLYLARRIQRCFALLKSFSIDDGDITRLWNEVDPNKTEMRTETSK